MFPDFLRFTVVAGALVSMAVAPASQDAGNWPQWRGPGGIGVADTQDAPINWSDGDGIAWRASLGGVGLSTPIVWGDRVFVTSQRGAGNRRDGNHPTLYQGGPPTDVGERTLSTRPDDQDAPVTFLIESFARADGEPLWTLEVPAVGELPAVHDKHNLASSSPVTDGERIYSVYGTGQVVAADLDGVIVWQRNLADEYGSFNINWGHTSSPIVYGDLLIIPCFHDPASYLLAVDARTGETRWRVDRGNGVQSYSTPVVVPTASGDELIINTSEALEAYRPETGEALWRYNEPNSFAIPAPVFHDGVIYATRGYRSGPYMAIRAGGRGDIDASRIEWSSPTGAPYVSSLAYADGLLFMAGDVGVVTCIDAQTGERVWQSRTGGVFSASPVIVGDRVYMVSETGETLVMRVAREPEVIARNTIEGRLLASPAFSGSRLFLRTDDEVVAVDGA